MSDPKIVDVFMECFDEIVPVQTKYADPTTTPAKATVGKPA